MSGVVGRLRRWRAKPAHGGHTGWSRLADLLGGPHGAHLPHTTLESFVRLALIGHIPRQDVRETAEAMFNDILWRHRDKHGPWSAPTVGTVRDICVEAHLTERGTC